MRRRRSNLLYVFEAPPLGEVAPTLDSQPLLSLPLYSLCLADWVDCPLGSQLLLVRPHAALVSFISALVSFISIPISSHVALTTTNNST
jgi:hypothetical protein